MRCESREHAIAISKCHFIGKKRSLAVDTGEPLTFIQTENVCNSDDDALIYGTVRCEGDGARRSVIHTTIRSAIHGTVRSVDHHTDRSVSDGYDSVCRKCSRSTPYLTRLQFCVDHVDRFCLGFRCEEESQDERDEQKANEEKKGEFTHWTLENGEENRWQPTDVRLTMYSGLKA